METPHKPVGGKIVIISDTHFGDASQLLNDAQLVNAFAGIVSGRGVVSELVLLGDIVDTWMKPLNIALKNAKYFMGKLCGLPNVVKVTYVPGNHDHQLFMDEYREEVARNIMAGSFTTPRFSPSRSYQGTTISYLQPKPEYRFEMVYPFIVREINGKEVVMTHGHHLDYFDRTFWWARTFWLSRYIIGRRRKKKRGKEPTLYEIETANLPFYGALSMTPGVPEIVESELRFYRILNFFNKLFHKRKLSLSPRRDTLIKDNYDEIEELLPLLGHPAPDCLVFGHTHRPGIGKIPGSGITVVNTGSWVSQDDDVPYMTWVEIDYDAKLFRLKDGKAELMYSESI